MSQNFHLFHASNLSVRNIRIFLLMYPGPFSSGVLSLLFTTNGAVSSHPNPSVLQTKLLTQHTIPESTPHILYLYVSFVCLWVFSGASIARLIMRPYLYASLRNSFTVMPSSIRAARQAPDQLHQTSQRGNNSGSRRSNHPGQQHRTCLMELHLKCKVTSNALARGQYPARWTCDNVICSRERLYEGRQLGETDETRHWRVGTPTP